MTTDPIDQRLQDSGLDPTPGYEAGLEAALGRAFDGETVPPSITPPSGRADIRRRFVVLAAAAAVVAAAVVGAMLFRDGRHHRSIVNVPPLITTAPAPTPPPTTTSPSGAPTTTGPSTDTNPPTTTAPVTTAATTATTALPTTTTTALPTTVLPTTVATAAPAPVTIDLAAPVGRIVPAVIASFPISPPGDLFPTAFATPAGPRRFAVLDDVTGQLRFVDAATAAVLATYSTPVPVIGDQIFIGGLVAVGPDDVLYVEQSDSGGQGQLVAYAPRSGSYVEVARVADPASPAVTLQLGRTGVVDSGSPGSPLLAYVGVDGKPSGAIVSESGYTLHAEGDHYRVERDNRSWAVAFTLPPESGMPTPAVCPLCLPSAAGPHGSVVLFNHAPGPGGDVLTKLTVLSDTITTYDTDWSYVGVLGDAMLFSKLTQSVIEIGAYSPSP